MHIDEANEYTPWISTMDGDNQIIDQDTTIARCPGRQWSTFVYKNYRSTCKLSSSIQTDYIVIFHYSGGSVSRGEGLGKTGRRM